MRHSLNAFLLAVTLFSTLLPPVGHHQLQESDPEVEAILEQMGPEERVGQLFLVTFYGSDVGPDSDIATLITQYQVGGVVLRAENDNFVDEEDLLTQVSQLTTELQTLAAERRQLPATEVPGPPVVPGPYIPLFIGIEHEGSNWPHTHLLSGVTPLPSNMAIGATWDPTLSSAVGEVVGEELSALGINLLLGPSADVVLTPQPLAPGNLGSRVFGGEPFWVSQMTAAYVSGVHSGSDGRIAVIPRHFPGYGGADRMADDEVPTVRRSLDQLIQFDLKPFFAVTGDATDPMAVADGVMTGHIRYLGFQGDNPRLATRPISLDPQALQVLLALDPVRAWHEDGGLVVSDALGLRGVRRFYDPQEVIFPNRRIAQNALLAGNDVLYLGNFGSNPPVNQVATVIDTIEFFVQAYNEDPAFQERVDEAVRRIIRKKLDLYDGQFDLNHVLPPEESVEALEPRPDVTFNVAREALTLLSPDHADQLDSPQEGERIVIFTDTRFVSQCSTCSLQPLIEVDALQRAILRLYGPEASGLVSPANIQSFTFEQLDNFLEFGPQTGVAAEGATPEPDPLAVALDSADWVVLLSLDVDSEIPSSAAVKRFLADPPVGPDTRVVVMAMGAPYYLDSTEISKLTAYYALYGYTEPFVDVAARALFLGVPFSGASPVSVSGINYDILEATSPDPDQIIGLSVSYAQEEEDTDATQTPSEVLLGAGDTLLLETSVILDRNGHPVPDGTPVEFVLNYINEGLRDTLPVTTVGGVAQASLLLDRPGELEITVVAGPARNSDTIRLFGGGIEVVRPELPSTPTPTPTQLPALQTTPGQQPTPEVFNSTPTPEARHASVDFGDLFLTLLGLAVIGAVSFSVGLVTRDVNYGLLLALPSVMFGLVAYNYYALLLPGAIRWRTWFGEAWGASTAAWFGALGGWGMTVLLLLLWRHWLHRFLRGYQPR